MKVVILILVVFCCTETAISQTDSIKADSLVQPATQLTFHTKLEVNGYIKILASSLVMSEHSNWVNDKLIHNRLNFKLDLFKNFKLAAEFRNRIFYGEMMDYFPGYDKFITADEGYFNLSRMIYSENKSFANVFLDRAYADYSRGKFQITAGRQRINWAQTFAWNPNDIYNTYSFFDFDYEEKPGCDALRIQYYRNATSSIEVAAKINSLKQVTAALLYKSDFHKYDIQTLAGVYNDSDLVAGFGWAGDLYKGGFRGELSYFHPVKNLSDTSGRLLFSVGYDYTFKNESMLRFEMLYNSAGRINGNISMPELYYEPLSAKYLSPADFSVFGQFSYPFDPLTNGSFAVNYLPNLHSLYLGPELDISVAENVELSTLLQAFINKQDVVYLFFFRLKWSF